MTAIPSVMLDAKKTESHKKHYVRGVLDVLLAFIFALRDLRCLL